MFNMQGLHLIQNETSRSFLLELIKISENQMEMLFSAFLKSKCTIMALMPLRDSYSSVADSFFCLSSHTAKVNRSKLADTLLTCHLCRSVHLQSIQFILFVQWHHSLHGAVCRDAERSAERSKVSPSYCVRVTGSLAWGQRLLGYSRIVCDLALHHRAMCEKAKAFSEVASSQFASNSPPIQPVAMRFAGKHRRIQPPLGNSVLVRIVPVV